MKIGTGIALAAMLAVTTVPGAFAQSGAEIYKSKCQSCHGVSGMGDTAMGKTLKVKPITDPSVLRYSEAAMIEATRNGVGKMQPYKGKLTDAEIKDSVAHFRSFIK
jgi:mono/diheme cytochrome c family protein